MGWNDFPDIIEVQSRPIAPKLVAQRLWKNLDINAYVLANINSTYVFCLQPTLAVTNKKLSSREQKIIETRKKTFPDQISYFRESYTAIDNILEKQKPSKLHYVNLSKIFDELTAKEEIFVDSYHFGDKGNEIIANNIFSRIKDIIDK